jgi:hypothetical protein
VRERHSRDDDFAHRRRSLRGQACEPDMASPQVSAGKPSEMPHLSVRLRALFLRRKPARDAERDLSLQISTSWTVLLPESFRGGCSFGAGNCRSLPSSLTLLTGHILLKNHIATLSDNSRCFSADRCDGIDTLHGGRLAWYVWIGRHGRPAPRRRLTRWRPSPSRP